MTTQEQHWTEKLHFDKVNATRAAEGLSVKDRVRAELDASRVAAGRYDAAAELLKALERDWPEAERIVELTLKVFK